MREGLRSHTQRSAEKGMIDLNEDPVEDDGSSTMSPPSSAYFSAEEKIDDHGMDVDVSSNAVGEGGEAARGANDADMIGNIGCALPSTNVGVIKEGLSKSRPLEGDGHAAAVHVLDLNASGGSEMKDEVAGKRRSGRERKMVGCGLPNAVHVLDLNASGGSEMKDEVAGKRRSGRKRKMVGCGLPNAGGLERSSMKEGSVNVEGTEEDVKKHEDLEHGQDVDMRRIIVCALPCFRLGSVSDKMKGKSSGNVAAAPARNTDEGNQESSKGHRGRKRKVLENSAGSLDSRNAGGEIQRLALDRTPQIVGRVLRSRTREANSGEKQVCSIEKSLGDRKGEMDLDRSGNRNVKMKIEESTRPAGNIKHGRGRPSKIHGRRNGSSKVTVNNKANLGPWKNSNLPGTKVKGHNLVKLPKKKVKSTFLKVYKGNTVDKKKGDIRTKEDKQLLKDRIVTILKEAGWTVQYRPRNGSNYLDAVYVDGQGRTHWSVTLAYRKLKKKIEDQTADEKEISAFSPIPGDQLRKLFRITQEGKKSKKRLKVGGSKTRNTTAEPQQGEIFLKKKIEGVNSEPGNSVAVSSRRKPKSRRGENRKPCGLLVRKSNAELDEGKRTLLSWMIDLGTISPGGKVQYMSHERADVKFEGKITREGIYCDCCGKIFTLRDFECHAGSLLGQPLQNICLESGKSLLQCMSESWRKLEEIDDVGFNFVDVENDPDDDTCNMCADGGNLICCDTCPSTFHQNCLQIQNFPTGDWHCVYCSCKFCGTVCWGSSEGDDVWDPADSGFLTCFFCEEKFHVSCMLKKEATRINTELLPFCGWGCQKLFENLQKLLGVKHELEKGFSWTILRRQDVSCSADLLKVESNSKLAIAFSIINECFTPIIDERSNINLIRSVCYSCGSNLRRLNYCGFCTFILEKSDELVSAATIRIHGNQLAEMPFIGTREIHRRKGMASMLLTAIEMALSSLDVEKLVIPSVPELSETWTKVFGFVPLEESERQEMKYMSLVLFPGADTLQKRLC